MEKIILSEVWQDFYNALPPMCSRELIAERSQIVERGTLANLDVFGKGIPNGRRVGKKICYPKNDVMLWLLKYCGEEIPTATQGENHE